jgi:hypothetical protein
MSVFALLMFTCWGVQVEEVRKQLERLIRIVLLRLVDVHLGEGAGRRSPKGARGWFSLSYLDDIHRRIGFKVTLAGEVG